MVNAVLEKAEDTIARPTGKLTVFFAADDLEVEPWNQETVFHSEWLDEPIDVGEIGTMGGQDRWDVVEVVQFTSDEAAHTVDLAIVHPADLITPERAKWLSVKYGDSLYVYLDSSGEFVTGGLGSVPPAIGEHLIGIPMKIASFKSYCPIDRAQEHFERLYLCSVVAC